MTTSRPQALASTERRGAVASPPARARDIRPTRSPERFGGRGRANPRLGAGTAPAPLWRLCTASGSCSFLLRYPFEVLDYELARLVLLHLRRVEISVDAVLDLSQSKGLGAGFVRSNRNAKGVGSLLCHLPYSVLMKLQYANPAYTQVPRNHEMLQHKNPNPHATDPALAVAEEMQRGRG